MALRPRTMLWRGVRRRCPVCGERKVFDGPLTIADDCPRCGLTFERIEGHWIGSLGLNTVVSFVLLFATLFAGLALTYPDIDVAPVIAAGLVVAIGFPIAFHGTAKTLWTAIDIIMRPLEMGEVAPGWELDQDPDADSDE